MYNGYMFKSKGHIARLIFISLFFVQSFSYAADKKADEYDELMRNGSAAEIKSVLKSDSNFSTYRLGVLKDNLLMKALEYGRPRDVITVLLKAGITSTQRNRNGQTAVMYACKYAPNKLTVSDVVKAGISSRSAIRRRLLSTDRAKKSALMYATENSTDVQAFVNKYFTKEELIKYLGLTPESVESIPQAVDEPDEPAPDISTAQAEEQAEDTSTAEETASSTEAQAEQAPAEPVTATATAPDTATAAPVQTAAPAPDTAAPVQTAAPDTTAAAPVQTATPAPDTAIPAPVQTATPAPDTATAVPVQTATPAPETAAATPVQTATPAPDTAVPAPVAEPVKNTVQTEPASTTPAEEKTEDKKKDAEKVEQPSPASKFTSHAVFGAPVAPAAPAEENTEEKQADTSEAQTDGQSAAAVEKPTVTTPPVTNPYKKTYLYDYAPEPELPEDETPAEVPAKNINTPDKNGLTPLMNAARTGNDWEIGKLITAGANVNAKDKDGWTALMYACRFQNSITVVGKLLENGAKVREFNNYGSSALVLAAGFCTNPDILSRLLSEYAPAENEVFKALVYAITAKAQPANVQQTKIQLFIDRGISLNRFWEGKTPLMYAAETCTSTDIIQLLLNAGAITSIHTSDGRSAFDFAKGNRLLDHDDVYWSLNTTTKK